MFVKLGRSRSAAWPLAALVVLIALAWAGLARGAMYTRWIQDIFIPLEGVVHLTHGDLPHRDFATPVGALYYLIEYLPTLLMPLSAGTLFWSNVLVAFVLFGLAVLVLQGRLPGWVTALTSLYIALVALSPRQLGEKITFITNNAAYNRWSWAILATLALFAALPSVRDERRTAVRDGTVAGALLAALFFLKMTYFVAGAALLLVAVLTVRRAQAVRFGAAAALTLAVTLVVVELSTGLIGLYLSDLRATVAVQPSKLRLGSIYALSVAFAPGGLVIALLALWSPRPMTDLRTALSPILMAFATFGAGLIVAVQNHLQLENPMIPVAALVAWFANRSDAASTDHGAVEQERWLQALAAPLAIMGLLVIPIAQDAGSLAWSATARTVERPELAWLEKTPLRDLRLLAVPWELEQPVVPNEFRNDIEFVTALKEGAGLLQRHIGTRRDVTVFPLTWSNPWPTLLGLRPVRGELAWWHDGRTFNAGALPNPALLESVDYVLVPHRYYNFPSTTAMLAAYDPVLRTAFQPVERSQYWTLMARTNCARRSLC